MSHQQSPRAIEYPSWSAAANAFRRPRNALSNLHNDHSRCRSVLTAVARGKPTNAQVLSRRLFGRMHRLQVAAQIARGYVGGVEPKYFTVTGLAEDSDLSAQQIQVEVTKLLRCGLIEKVEQTDRVYYKTVAAMFWPFAIATLTEDVDRFNIEP